MSFAHFDGVPAFWAGTPDATDETLASDPIAADVASMFAQIDGIGHPVSGDTDPGYYRFAWSEADRELRSWFAAQAEARGLTVTVDRAGNQWAWWEPSGGQKPGEGEPEGKNEPAELVPEEPVPTDSGKELLAVTTGSHLDSVPGGGAFDGPLGVLSGLAAISVLKREGFVPGRPIGLANFSDEEGAAFGLACFGSRVLTGVIAPEDALNLRGDDGVSLREKLTDAGIDTASYGADPEVVARIGRHIELHVEQGYYLEDTDSPVAVASHIWPHGRWRITLRGHGNHAGTTPLARRDDPMLALARLVNDARAAAERHGGLATIGKMLVEPNGVNVIASSVTVWVDCRADQEATVHAIMADLDEYSPVQESWTSATDFNSGLILELADVVGEGAVPVIGTGAGHDAGILAQAGVPTGMIFVRNVTGDSHTPTEFARLSDAASGVRALVSALRHCAGGPS